ncbi:hypothetical protein RRG08_013074 [Elysia crispata]|uniref:Uncharacterized protein n=1 Tax=Elysia crispata TaxID=231223 RepID=A0AAE1A1A9_9GAST|nr:hypothetical protein RRG08_013074 [Elysia crispata]
MYFSPDLMMCLLVMTETPSCDLSKIEKARKIRSKPQTDLVAVEISASCCYNTTRRFITVSETRLLEKSEGGMEVEKRSGEEPRTEYFTFPACRPVGGNSKILLEAKEAVGVSSRQYFQTLGLTEALNTSGFVTVWALIAG